MCIKTNVLNCCSCLCMLCVLLIKLSKAIFLYIYFKKQGLIIVDVQARVADCVLFFYEWLFLQCLNFQGFDVTNMKMMCRPNEIYLYLVLECSRNFTGPSIQSQKAVPCLFDEIKLATIETMCCWISVSVYI